MLDAKHDSFVSKEKSSHQQLRHIRKERPPLLCRMHMAVTHDTQKLNKDETHSREIFEHVKNKKGSASSWHCYWHCYLRRKARSNSPSIPTRQILHRLILSIKTERLSSRWCVRLEVGLLGQCSYSGSVPRMTTFVIPRSIVDCNAVVPQGAGPRGPLEAELDVDVLEYNLSSVVRVCESCSQNSPFRKHRTGNSR